MAQTQRSGLPRLWFSVAVPLGINGGAARHSKTGRLYPKAGWNHPKQQPLSPQACPTSYLHSLPETHRSYPKLGRHLFFLFIAVRRTARAGRLPTGGPQHAACASRVAVPPGRPPHRNNAPLPLLFVRFVLGALLALSSSGRSLRGPRQRELRASAAGGFGPRDPLGRKSTAQSTANKFSPKLAPVLRPVSASLRLRYRSAAFSRALGNLVKTHKCILTISLFRRGSRL